MRITQRSRFSWLRVTFITILLAILLSAFHQQLNGYLKSSMTQHSRSQPSDDLHKKGLDEVHPQLSQYLLNQGAEDINARPGSKETALMTAIYEHQPETVRFLLDHGADINAQDASNETALMAAVNEQHLEIVRILLDHGPDINAEGGYSGSALMAAISPEPLIMMIIADELIDHGAVNNLRTEIFNSLFDRGADVNIVGGEHGSALQAAIGTGNQEMVKKLLNRGANVNHLVCAGYGSQRFCGPLQAAAGSSSSTEMLKLISEGSPVNINAFAHNGTYCSALQVAALQGGLDAVTFLLERGADVNLEQDCHGRFRTVLGAARQPPNWLGTEPEEDEKDEIVRLLLQHGAR